MGEEFVADGLRTELKKLGVEVMALRVKGRNLQLPDEIKIRVWRVWRAGIRVSEIRRHTGIQAVSIRCWEKKLKLADGQKTFRVLNVVQDEVPFECQKTKKKSKINVEANSNSNSVLVFRYDAGVVRVEISEAKLTPKLMRILALC